MFHMKLLMFSGLTPSSSSSFPTRLRPRDSAFHTVYSGHRQQKERSLPPQDLVRYQNEPLRMWGANECQTSLASSSPPSRYHGFRRSFGQDSGLFIDRSIFVAGGRRLDTGL